MYLCSNVLHASHFTDRHPNSEISKRTICSNIVWETFPKTSQLEQVTQCFLTAQIVSLLIRAEDPDDCWIFHAAHNRKAKSDQSPLTCQNLKYKLKHSLILTYVSSRCCSRVDSITDSRKKPLNSSFVCEVLLFILTTLMCYLLPQSFRMASADCHVREGFSWGPNYTKRVKNTKQDIPKTWR